MKIFLGVRPLKNANNVPLKNAENAKNGFCAAFKASTSVDCGPIWFKLIALAQFFAHLQDKRFLFKESSLKCAKNACKYIKSDKNVFFSI